MKKISIFTILFSTLFLVSSCTDDNKDFVVSETTPIVLSDLDISNVELDQLNPTNPAVTFNWTDANYGQQTSLYYTLQVSSNAAFTNPVVVTTVNATTTATLSVEQLNAAAYSAGLPPFAWNPIYARVVSTVGTTSSLPVASNNITFSVYPYYNYPFKDYYLVGDATQPGWNNNNNNPPLFRDGANPNIYYYYGYFGAGQFKVLEKKGFWQPQWGTNNGSGINVNPGNTSDPGTFPNNNSPIATAGLKKFTINFSNNSFTFETYTPSNVQNYSAITIQGSSLTSTSMTQSTFDTHIWFKNNIHLVPGNLKFITNTNSEWGGLTSFSGLATLNGGNIPVVVEADYDVWFNDLSGHYILIPLNL
jgi:hypothetical protein